MYKVTDDMKRLEFLAEIPVSYYTDDDIEYLQNLINIEEDLISEGAAFTLYISCRYLIAAVAKEYEKECLVRGTEVPKEIHKLFYQASRKGLPRFFNRFDITDERADIEIYTATKLSLVYKKILKDKLFLDI